MAANATGWASSPRATRVGTAVYAASSEPGHGPNPPYGDHIDAPAAVPTLKAPAAKAWAESGIRDRDIRRSWEVAERPKRDSAPRAVEVNPAAAALLAVADA